MAVVVGASVLAGGVVPAAPPARAASDSIVLRWSELLLDSVRNSTLGPPMVARALAIAHTCMYDAWAPYDPVATGIVHAMRLPAAERTEANKAEAISFAAYRAAVDLFPNRKPQIDAFMAGLGYDPALNPPDTTTPAGVGVHNCANVLDTHHPDGSNQDGELHTGPYTDFTGYVPANDPMVVALPLDKATVKDPNKWQPLTYQNKTGATVTPPFLGAHWANVRPFAESTGTTNRSMTSPATFGSQQYVDQANELLAISANLTDQHKAIAEYWADGPNSETPPGHWCLLAAFVSRRDHHTLDQDVKMYFALANAGMDAGIAAWLDKRTYDSVRPITAIRYLYHGKPVTAWAGPGLGTQTFDGAMWKPYQPTWFPTPPFGEYVSGHSTFSAAAAEVLRSFTGSDEFGFTATVRAGSSFVELGRTPATDVKLHWPTFSAAADEAGMSRRYGGIHFAQGDLDGRRLGRLVGEAVWQKANAYFMGLDQNGRLDRSSVAGPPLQPRQSAQPAVPGLPELPELPGLPGLPGLPDLAELLGLLPTLPLPTIPELLPPLPVPLPALPKLPGVPALPVTG